MRIIPKEGLKGLVENWQSDLLAALSVSMVAMPLALGIAFASDVPPMAGILSAIIGGVVTTFFRGSHVAINGPAAGLIAVILGSIAVLDDGSGQALNYVLAAIVISGGIQIVLGLLKLGRFAEIFHPSVIHGILAAIGIIIFARQIHIALGIETPDGNVFETLYDVIRQIHNINPFVAIISLMGLLLLIFHSRISYRLFHFLPAPMWVLLISIPFVYAFRFFEPHSIELFGSVYAVGPDLLVRIPANLLDAIAFPNFAKINTLAFWSSVLSITMIASIESLASSKAVDKLDPYKRKTDLNKDLVGVGLSTMVSGMLGGLPIITVIVRSTVNVQNNAKTKWSNLYHGLLLLLFIFFMAPLIQKVPLSALAILLVFTGFKLASPQVFKHVYSQGIEQLIFFLGTLIITLLTNLLVGIFGGLLLALLLHFLMARLPIRSFFRMIFRSGSKLILQENGSYDLKIRGIANFLATIRIDNLLSQIPSGSDLRIDFSEARLVDTSIMENVSDFRRIQTEGGGKVDISGLDAHVSTSTHVHALKILIFSPTKLTHRQISLRDLAEERAWDFSTEPGKQVDFYQTFYFFKPRPIVSKTNCISGQDEELEWEIADVTFDEGAFAAFEEYKTTLGLVKFPFSIPKFTIEKKRFLDKYLNLSAHKDIDYVLYNDFSRDYIVKVEDREEMKAFLTDELRALFESDEIHHLESNGEAILIFNGDLRLARIPEYLKMSHFAEELRGLIKGR